jgi:hypothetical protein
VGASPLLKVAVKIASSNSPVVPKYVALAVAGCTARESGDDLPPQLISRPIVISVANANVGFMAGTINSRSGFVKVPQIILDLRPHHPHIIETHTK